MLVIKEEMNSYFLGLLYCLECEDHILDIDTNQHIMQLSSQSVIFCILGINTVLKVFPWKKGDEILATTHTYCSIQNTCRKAAQISTGVIDIHVESFCNMSKKDI